ncbi:DUF3343 domain-containing protein [Clostridium formicaceticum]|jgi:hypothetical protein|uniref:Putative Se/S carrier protein-like domain-containing protein n=1 Tax=Clostridium formicaceticum TaxID=1497 RepID=A0AAC9RII5_9CLOT|nr:DUF3343 domain-containing protein [Clostridium formicaceticum]ARE85718.1 hypothetical protein CLFO_00310 [Clostridium formicaceticum]
MKIQEMYVIVFESTHYAIAAEKLLKQKKYEFDTIPTPREITASCGLSIMFDETLLGYIKKDIMESNIKIKGIYEIKKTANEKTVKQIN